MSLAAKLQNKGAGLRCNCWPSFLPERQKKKSLFRWKETGRKVWHFVNIHPFSSTYLLGLEPADDFRRDPEHVASLPNCMTVKGNLSTWRKPTLKRGEHELQTWESNPGPLCCEVTALTTPPLCSPHFSSFICNYHKVAFAVSLLLRNSHVGNDSSHTHFVLLFHGNKVSVLDVFFYPLPVAVPCTKVVPLWWK